MQVTCRCCSGSRASVYELTEAVRFCCAEMRREWGVLIGFGVNGRPRTTSREVNLLGLRQCPVGTIIPALTEIRFCPWCGETIEVVGEP
jgi:hypothetical protein